MITIDIKGKIDLLYYIMSYPDQLNKGFFFFFFCQISILNLKVWGNDTFEKGFGEMV